MFRLQKKTNEKYYYALDGRDARLVKLLGILGLISTVFIVLGFLQFLHISPLLAILFGPVLIIILLYHVIQYLLLSFYPGFDLVRHRQKVLDYWHSKPKAPRVAVFIPAAGESVEVVEATVRAATKITYPNYKVFVLDDSKDAIYKPLASKLRVEYLRRPNIGAMKKAGNMNYALRQISGYEHVLVLDADFQPRPEVLLELVPYTSEDTGIIQSPQHFPLDAPTHYRSKIEYGAAYIQQDFYRITQVARNRFGAAICVGTSALYNIEALRRVGGYEGVGQPKGWSHSEDVHTGLKMLNSFTPSDTRYQIKYIPVQLTKGSCPDTHHSFYKQQNRWATGSMQLLLSDKTVRSSRLSPMQRLIYGSNSLYYFYTMSLLMSPVYLLVLALSSQPSSWAFTLYFIPSLVFKHVIEPYVMRRQRAPLATSLVVISNAYTFFQAAVLLIIRKPLGWEATGTSSGKKSRHFTNFKVMAMFGFISLYIVTLCILIMNEHFEYGSSIFIVGLFLTAFFAHLAFLLYTLIMSAKQGKLLLDRKFYAAIVLIGLTVFAVYQSYSHHKAYNLVVKDSRIQFVEQKTYIEQTETPIDGYRRTLGDLKEMFNL